MKSKTSFHSAEFQNIQRIIPLRKLLKPSKWPHRIPQYTEFPLDMAIRFLEEERKYLLPVHAANGHIHNPMHLSNP